MDRQRQGDLGEASARFWYETRGWDVYVPTGHTRDADFVVDDGARLLRVQVKTSGARRNGRWEVAICTRGGNQSWSGVTKYFSAERCDVLFVVVADGRRWCLPAGCVEATSSLCLGGPKYARHEVDPGPPLSVSAERFSLLSPTPAG